MRVLQAMETNHQMSHKGLNKDELPWDIQGLPMSKRLSHPCANHAEGQADTYVTSNTILLISYINISNHVMKQSCKEMKLAVITLT